MRSSVAHDVAVTSRSCASFLVRRLVPPCFWNAPIGVFGSPAEDVFLVADGDPRRHVFVDVEEVAVRVCERRCLGAPLLEVVRCACIGWLAGKLTLKLHQSAATYVRVCPMNVGLGGLRS